MYRNDPKFSDRQVWANSADPDQTAPSLTRVYTVCHCICTFWTHFSIVEPTCSKFIVITANFSSVRNFRIFTVLVHYFFHQIFSPSSQLKVWSYRNYRNDPKFSDRYAWANSADPDQTAPRLIRVYTVCHSVCIVWTHYSMVEPHSSNFRVITTNFWGVRIFRKFTVMILSFRMNRSWQTVQTQRSSLIRVYTVLHFRLHLLDA